MHLADRPVHRHSSPQGRQKRDLILRQEPQSLRIAELDSLPLGLSPKEIVVKRIGQSRGSCRTGALITFSMRGVEHYGAQVRSNSLSVLEIRTSRAPPSRW